MKEETVIKYFNIVLNGAEKFDVFSINNILLKKYFNPQTEKEREYFHELCDRIEKIATKLKFFEDGKNGWFELSDKGRKSKELGGYFEYEKYIEQKELESKKNININIGNLTKGNNYGTQSSGNTALNSPVKQKTVNKTEKEPSKKSWIEIASWIIGSIVGLIVIYEFIIKKLLAE
jgi:hypothetical protein